MWHGKRRRLGPFEYRVRLDRRCRAHQQDLGAAIVARQRPADEGKIPPAVEPEPDSRYKRFQKDVEPSEDRMRVRLDELAVVWAIAPWCARQVYVQDQDTRAQRAIENVDVEVGRRTAT